MRLAAYLLWIPGLFAVIAAVILPVVSSCLSRRSRAAASWQQIGCGQVRAVDAAPVGDEPVHVHGASAPGPAKASSSPGGSTPAPSRSPSRPLW